jgi:hypothetical protein
VKYIKINCALSVASIYPPITVNQMRPTYVSVYTYFKSKNPYSFCCRKLIKCGGYQEIKIMDTIN